MGEGIYRVPAPKPPVPPDPYLRAWASLRRRRMTMWISHLAFLPMALVALRFLGGLASFVILLHMTVLPVSYAMAAQFRCPHCRELFAKRSGWGIHVAFEEAFVRCCLRCGIRVGTPRSAVVADATGDVAATEAESE